MNLTDGTYRSYKSHGVPGCRTEQAVLILLTAEPSVETVLVKRVAALTLGDVADDRRIGQQHAVGANCIEGLPTDGTGNRD
jgi:hypothetical protein